MFTACWKYVTSTEPIEEDIVHGVVINEPIQEGQAIFISAQIMEVAPRFLVDFCLDNENKDIALRLDFTIYDFSLERNSRIDGNWGVPESSVPRMLRIRTSMDFEIQVFFEVEVIKIAFENRHVANYRHRLPFNLIRSVIAHGYVRDVIVERKTLLHYPELRSHIRYPELAVAPGPHRREPTVEILQLHDVDVSVGEESSVSEVQFLTLPYYTTFSKSFFELGHGMIVSGKVSPSPNIIKVTLQVGREVVPPPKIVMQLVIRFSEKRDVGTDEPAISFNSFLDDKWTGEFKCELENGLQPGGDFHLVIGRGATSFQIHMNKRHIHNYPYVTNPRIVDTCCIEGDIKLITAANENENVWEY